jgi:hypothetical protein
MLRRGGSSMFSFVRMAQGRLAKRPLGGARAHPYIGTAPHMDRARPHGLAIGFIGLGLAGRLGECRAPGRCCRRRE